MIFDFVRVSMADKPEIKPKPEDALPELKNWGLRRLEGSVAGVRSKLEANAKIPEWFKRVLLDDIGAAIEGTEDNFVVLHAHGTWSRGFAGTRHIVSIDLTTSKKAL